MNLNWDAKVVLVVLKSMSKGKWSEFCLMRVETARD